MVDIKGLDKARVMEALKNEAIRSADAPGMRRNVFGGEISHEQSCKRVTVDLGGDEFDERGYDSIFGEGTAQRAVDSVRAEREQEGSEKKNPSLEEKTQRTKDALKKIADIMLELQPEERYAATMLLKMMLMGPGTLDMAGLLMMGGPMKSPPFPFKGRFG